MGVAGWCAARLSALSAAVRASLLAMLVVIVLLLAGASGLAAQTPINVGASAPRGVVIYLRLQSGSVRLSGWDRDSVHVQGELAPGESWVNRLSGDTLRMRAEGLPRGLSAPSELEIFVPRGSALVVRAAAASMVVRDFDASVDVATAAGNLLVESVLGDVRAETMQGTLAVIGPVPRVDASTASGALLVSVPYDTLGEGDERVIVRRVLAGRQSFDVATVRSVSGDITFSAPMVDSALVQNVRGGTRVVAAPSPGGLVRVTSHAGLISLGWGETDADGGAASSPAAGAVRLDALAQLGGLRGRVPGAPVSGGPGAGVRTATVDAVTRVQRTPAGAWLRQMLDGRGVSTAVGVAAGAAAAPDSTAAAPRAGLLQLRNVRGDIVFESLAPSAPSP